MASLSDIRAAICATLSAVPNVGRVHSYEAWVKDQRGLADMYVADGQLRGWQVRRLATEETHAAAGLTQVLHRWLIRGFMALDQDSELVFDDFIESIRAAFRADPTLGGVVEGTDDGKALGEAGVQVVDSKPLLFAGVLCHSAELELLTRHYVETMAEDEGTSPDQVFVQPSVNHQPAGDWQEVGHDG